MTSAPATKKVKRFRVKIGKSYAALDFNFHEKGALVRTPSVIGAWVFKRNVDAGNAIQRTNRLQKEIREGMHAEWDRFAPLNYDDTPTVEEFEVEEQDGPSDEP